MARHYLVFVHGIGERQPDKPSKESHLEADVVLNQSYANLWNNLAQNFEQSTSSKFNKAFAPVYTDWHTEQINLAESTIYNAAFPELAKRKWSLIRPLRNFATFFLGDVIAYVSKDVNVIRRTVWNQMWDQLQRPLKEENATYSIIAHSLGTVVAFDYLFYLLKHDKLFVEELNPGMAISPEDRQLLRQRFRFFFTMGSPIGLFMLREGRLWADGEPFQKIYNPIRGENCTWLNFYDSKDIIAYPLKGLFNTNRDSNQDCLPEDIPVWSGWTPFGAHTNYWKNKEVARRIVETLSQSPKLIDGELWSPG